MARKLKVFRTSIGFEDALVAVPSQKAALAAWGTKTDLFAAGRADLVEDETLAAPALKSPGQVIRTPRGDRAAMLGPAPAPSSGARPRKRGGEAARAGRPKPRKTPPPPDRHELDEAEHAIAAAEQDLEQALDRLARERQELDRREDELRSQFRRDIAKLRRAKEQAEKRYDTAERRHFASLD